ncbi:MAG: ImmA/IrrE family metallo-endopeptidase [Acidimicrobiaceae bacterium]|nr:ImmA/IrrE family metallo-endopeptidase [Acidimicrobiaceae bacterium]MYG54582.1 ImmA/IrrE family metallo-endopeptidase [Acidimicrobiaceae bacterium]MYJ97701.1 ImmA/IrrE family metallo-endopeptidase [Acidimicrobiaceae bacterium]
MTPNQNRSAVTATRISVSIACLMVMLAVSTPPAGADPFGVGPPEEGWLADNHDHDYCWSTGFNWMTLRNHATRSMEYLESSTDFSGGSLQACNSGTDIYFEQYDTTDYRGRYVCFDRGGGNRCDRAYIRISSNRSKLPVDQRRKTICHEVGHSAGASHHSSGFWGCMIRGTSTAEYYVYHTIQHMNSLEVSES